MGDDLPLHQMHPVRNVEALWGCAKEVQHCFDHLLWSGHSHDLTNCKRGDYKITTQLEKGQEKLIGLAIFLHDLHSAITPSTAHWTTTCVSSSKPKSMRTLWVWPFPWHREWCRDHPWKKGLTHWWYILSCTAACQAASGEWSNSQRCHLGGMSFPR